MRVRQHQPRRPADALGKKAEHGQPSIQAQRKRQVALIHRPPAHLEHMAKHQRVNTQHEQRRQHQPGRAQPRLPVARMHSTPRELPDQCRFLQREKISAKKIHGGSGLGRVNPALGNVLDGTQPCQLERVALSLQQGVEK